MKRKVIVLLAILVLFAGVAWATTVEVSKVNSTVTVSGMVTTTPSGKQVVQGGSAGDTPLSVTLTDTSIDDGGGSLTVDFTKPDTAVTVVNTPAVTMTDRSSVDTGMLSDDIQVDSVTVNPYTFTEKHYTNVKKIEIYNSSKLIQVFFSKTTGTPSGSQYWPIPATSPGYVQDNLRFADLYVNLKEGGGSDTPICYINIWK